MAVQAIGLVQEKLMAVQSLFSRYFPEAELPFFQYTIDTLDEYKDEAAVIFGLLATAFQMIFGGGFRYLTSKMKNLSDHKLKI